MVADPYGVSQTVAYSTKPRYIIISDQGKRMHKAGPTDEVQLHSSQMLRVWRKPCDLLSLPHYQASSLLHSAGLPTPQSRFKHPTYVANVLSASDDAIKNIPKPPTSTSCCPMPTTASCTSPIPPAYDKLTICKPLCSTKAVDSGHPSYTSSSATCRGEVQLRQGRSSASSRAFRKTR